MAKKPKEPQRVVKTRQDLGSITAIQYNDSAGAQKNLDVIPAPLRTTTAGENVGPGKLVKIAAVLYDLELKGKAYDVSATYQVGDIVTRSTFVYLNSQPVEKPEAFDAVKWIKKASALIEDIPSISGDIVTTGRWHNSVSVVGFLIDDDSKIDHTRVRD